MNTTARIARLMAEAEELAALSHDKMAEAYHLLGHYNLQRRELSYAVSCRERAANYIIEAEQAERENG